MAVERVIVIFFKLSIEGVIEKEKGGVAV